MIKTMGVQSFDFSDPSPYLLLEAIDDILTYLNQDIVIQDGYAFLNRKDISLDSAYEGSIQNKQYYVNGLLITGLFEQLGNEEYYKIEKEFEDLIETVSVLLERKLKNEGVGSSHCIFVDKDEDYGDIVIGFWKKGPE